MAVKVMVFADEANAVGAARAYNRRLDWLKVRDFLADPREGRELLEMVVYSGLPPENMDEWAEARSRKMKFIHWLRTNGFLSVQKNGSPTEPGRYKANVDVLMAIDAVELSVTARPDVVVLVTGDSDFGHLAYTLRRRGIRVEVAASPQTLSSELRAAANEVIDLVPLFNDFAVLHGDRADRIGTDDVFDEIVA